jgi:hypothetical protein
METLETLSLLDLKKLAKARKIKQYYIMKKEDLIALLRMEELPFKYKLEKMTIVELRAIAKERKLRGFWGMSKEDLTRVLFPPGDDKKQQDGEASEHEDPKNENADQVRENLASNPLQEGPDHTPF